MFSGRRLFSPCTSTVPASTTSCSSSSPSQSARCLNLQLSVIPEESANTTAGGSALNSPMLTSPLSRNPSSRLEVNQENSIEMANIQLSNYAGQSLKHANSMNTPSPLSERQAVGGENHSNIYNSPPANNNGGSSLTNTFYSPTSNLPNYVLDGEAPHLGIMSPKRKAKDKVDWLTKIRKQKLMSNSRGSSLSEKMQDDRLDLIVNGGGVTNSVGVATAMCSSPRLQSLRQSEGSPRTPRRRISHSNAHEPHSPSTSHSHNHGHTPRTPTSSRRNSETSILRFFSIQRNVSAEDSNININNVDNSQTPSTVNINSNSSNSITNHSETAEIMPTTSSTMA